MNKILLIIQREYLTRVKKRSFIIMTLITPLLIGAMIVVPVWMMNNSGTSLKKVAVVTDNGQKLPPVVPDTKYIKFDYLENVRFEDLKKNFKTQGYYGVLFVSSLMVNVPTAVQLVSDKQPPLDMVMHIENSLEKEIERQKLEAFNISNLDEIMKSVETKIQVQTIKISEGGEEKKSSTGITMGIAYIAGFMIYMFTFMFGSQVMRGVIEEKTNRIVEVVISSVKPFQLMMGKIVGIALVGLTKFLLWVILTGIIVTVVQSTVMPKNMTQQLTQQSIMAPNAAQQPMGQATVELNDAQKFLEAINNVPWIYIILVFIFYFLGGYLLYGSLFAAIGSAVDNETDTQQFMLPITIPLILALFVMLNAFQNPDSHMAYWFSLIPFTSPIVMMARVPFGVPTADLAISMVLLVLTFLATTWLAGKIYRVGILMYGKKPSYREMMKWIRYKG
jgi:ABC-2 type transport system permease protein